ncbi:DUF927 domain-containing protein [Citrobacter freundii]|uniref:DUF927 domain-containing protein n=1 Tax=Enterobacteriaceae TaxID=543 RepID=UPI000C6D29A0|nr:MULTISPECIES: DUF927 domain-containing protein [Enterobacteriaceae]AUZ71425.1 propanediol utilization protein [Citrobacter freundii complex sp. CFNIH4]EIY4397820.1 DUF927 domain-containing protein [Escherichia coli]ELK6345408.1 DUF927 domain-containing protein [Citrobacter freundii]MBV7211868.1 DUF927 domain-containing protein [Escherichia coli]MBV7235332.1 DUF927 domain-containing protein [Escherichia coli]
MSRAIEIIREVKRQAAGSWESLLPQCGVTVPPKGRHGPCAICGGSDRFHYIDDHGGGEWHCRQCDEPNHGDGLDLIARSQGITITAAAQKVSSVLGVDARTPEPKPAREKPQTDIAGKVAALAAKASPGQSAYLASKGLQCPFPMLSDGSLLLVLKNGADATTGAQVIKPDGSKRLVAGTVKKGSFCVVNTGETPETVIIAEGLATALSVQQFRPDATIIAAIDAGNLLPVAQVMRQRYPGAQIIIAADNDIKPGEPNTGKSAAENAAKAVSGWVALPQTEGKADWNDFHQQHGPEAAAAAFDDSLYQPGGNMPVQLKAIEGGKQTASDGGEDLKPYFDKRKGGLYYIEKKQNQDTGAVDERETWVSDEMETVGIGSDGKDGYIVIRMKQEGTGTLLYEAMPRRELGSPQGWGRLRSRGVNITARRAHLDLLTNHLQLHGDREQWTITHTAGWHEGAYVMPDGHIIGKPERPVAFCGGTSAVTGYVVRGTAAEWRSNVASLMRGNKSMVLGALVAFAAPLNSLAGGSCFGIHLFAQSSAGKTTTVEAASSIYGVPDELKLTWDATKYGLTIEAASRNDGFMPIDEIGQGNNAKDVAGSAYSLFNGTGRIQGHKDGGNRAVLRWAIVALSTGEEDFETYLLRNGLTPKAGQLVRLVSVPFSDTTEFHDLDDGDQHSRAIKRASSKYCGAVGREWIAMLAADRESACQKVSERENAWLSNLPEDLSPQAKRVAIRFALLDAAAELSMPLTGWSLEETRAHIKSSFDEWLDNYGTGNREKYQVVSRARDFIQRYALNRFQPYTFGKRNGDMDNLSASRITNLAGYLVSGRREDGCNEYHIIPSVFESEILCGIQKKLGAEALEEVGMLVRREPGRIDGKTISVNGSQQRFIVLIDGED